MAERTSVRPLSAARHFQGMDAVRATAALMVLGLHVTHANFDAPTNAGAAITAQLGGGVDIFFVLSGFLLYRPFARAIAAGRDLPERGRFWQNRALRIVPAYWAALIVFLALGLLPTINAALVAANFAFLQAWIPHHQTDLIAPAWTLCSEAVFYLVLPLYAARVGTRRRGGTAELRWMLVAFAVLTLTRVLIKDVGATHIRPVIGSLDATFIGTADMFLVGMALAVIAVDSRLRARAQALCPRRNTAWAIAAVVYVAGALVAWAYDFTRWSFGGRAWMMAIALLLVAPVALDHGDVRFGRVGRAMTAVGIASYGLYIWQFPIVGWLRDQGDLGAVGFPVVAASVCLSTGFASYYLIERQFIRRRVTQQPA